LAGQRLKYLETYVTIIRPYAVKDAEEKAVFLNSDGKALTYVALRSWSSDMQPKLDCRIM